MIHQADQSMMHSRDDEMIARDDGLNDYNDQGYDFDPNVGQEEYRENYAYQNDDIENTRIDDYEYTENRTNDQEEKAGNPSFLHSSVQVRGLYISSY